MKKCRKCKLEKQETEFHKNKKGVLSSYCRVCRATLSKEYRNKNFQKVKARERIYYNSNKNKISERKKIGTKISALALKYLDSLPFDEFISIIEKLTNAKYKAKDKIKFKKSSKKNHIFLYKNLQ